MTSQQESAPHSQTEHSRTKQSRIEQSRIELPEPGDSQFGNSESRSSLGPFDYIKDPETISQKSFEVLSREANLSRFPPDIRPIVTRMIHATGLVALADDVAWSGNPAEATRKALEHRKPILCDAEMVRSGLTRMAEHEILCMLNAQNVAGRAEAAGITRSAAGVELWPPVLSGAVVVIGNAPTALFRLLEGLGEGWPMPAVIFGLPVGFIGAAESKQALMEANLPCACLTVHGRMGGSAMAAGAVNALVS